MVSNNGGFDGRWNRDGREILYVASDLRMITVPVRTSPAVELGTPATLFALTDVDKINIPNPTVTWWTDLPYKPVHGDLRNELYFDWRVAQKKVSW